MKTILSLGLVILFSISNGQDKDERIKRDIEVAENVLSTLIRQQMERKSSFWSVEVKGSYTPGFGVTLRIPYENSPMAFAFSTEDIRGATSIWAPEAEGGDVVIRNGNGATVIERRAREEGQDKKIDKEKNMCKFASGANKFLQLIY